MKKIYFLFSLAIFLLIPLTTEAAATKKNGEFCTSNEQCLSDDCEDHVCDCSDGASCAAGLQSGSASDWICFDEEKDPLTRGNDFCVKSNSTYANGSTLPNTNNSEVFYPINDKLRIGELCPDEDDTCLTKNCEKSDETYSNGETKYYCTCNESKDCSVAYGGETNDWRCEGDDNNDLSYCKNDKTGNTILATNVSYRDITLSDVLEPEGLAASFQNDLANIIQKPQPKIPIPGLNFSEVDLSKMSSVDETGTSWLNMPFLGEYISAIYKYGMIILSLAAVIGIIIGGVTLITSGGSSDMTNSAKKRIVMSVLGLVIAATSYTILYAVNPELVNLRNVKVILVKGEPFPVQNEDVPDTVANSTNGMAKADKLTQSTEKTPTGQAVAAVGKTPARFSSNSNPIPYLIGELPNNIVKCSAEAFQYTAQKLDEQHVCVGSCHCAYTASHFLNYIGCSIGNTGSAPSLSKKAKDLGWKETEVTKDNYKNLPIGLAMMTSGKYVIHAGISLGNNAIFDSSAKEEAYKKVNQATGNTCPALEKVDGRLIPVIFSIIPEDNTKNCSGCSLIPSEAPITGRYATAAETAEGARFYGSLVTGTNSQKGCTGIQFWAIRTNERNSAKEFNFIYTPPGL